MITKQSHRLIPISIFGIIITHLIATLAFFYVSKSAVIICIVLTWLTGWVGIALCFHRLLTHRSFKTPKWFEYVLTIIGTMAWQGGPIHWVGVHRIHHKESDTSLDPHTPRHGFAWAHIFWLFYKDKNGRDAYGSAKDLLRDNGLVLIDRFFWIPQALLTLLLFSVGMIIGGLNEALCWVAWGIGVRTVLVYHSTWFVNSASHTWGYRNTKTRDHSTNLWWVALLSGGEGWHSNHHAQPSSAAHGIKWWEFDPTYLTIKCLSFVGLASHIIKPSKND